MKQKHVKLFEDFSTTASHGLKVGDIVFVKPTEAEFTVVAVDPGMASKITDSIQLYSPDSEAPPIRLVVSDPLKNYVVCKPLSFEGKLSFLTDNPTGSIGVPPSINKTGDQYRARLVSLEEAIYLNKDYPNTLLGKLEADGSLDWIEEDHEDDNDSGVDLTYIVPAVKNKILYVDGWGSIIFQDDDIEDWYVLNPEDFDPEDWDSFEKHQF